VYMFLIYFLVNLLVVNAASASYGGGDYSSSIYTQTLGREQKGKRVSTPPIQSNGSRANWFKTMGSKLRQLTTKVREQGRYGYDSSVHLRDESDVYESQRLRGQQTPGDNRGFLSIFLNRQEMRATTEERLSALHSRGPNAYRAKDVRRWQWKSK